MASWIVLDWDQDQFHVLCAQSSRRGVQVTHAVTWVHPEPFTPSTADRVGKALREFLKSAKIAAAPVIVGIGRDRVFLKELHFPQIAAHEEASLVRFQTGKEMAESMESYAVDYAHLSHSGADRHVMTVAARRDIVTMVQNLCNSAGLKLHAVTPRLFGQAQAVARGIDPEPSPLRGKQLIVALNVGQRWAELCFFRGDRLLQAQALANGPLLAGEVKRSLAVFQAQHAVNLDLEGPECIHVFGDDPAIQQSLQAGLLLPVRIVDPLKQEPEVASQTKHPAHFAGGVGLAALWAQAGARPVNLAAPKRQSAPVSMTKQRVLAYSAAAAFLLIFFIGFMAYILYDRRSQIAHLTNVNKELKGALTNNAQERADLEAYKEWEQTTVPWLDELYDLTARYPHAVGFRVNQLHAVPIATKKGAKDSFVGKMTLSGVTPKADDRGLVHELQLSMSRDPHVRPSVESINKGAYTMKIDVGKQDAKKYETHLIVPPRPVIQASPPKVIVDDSKKAEPSDPEGDDQ